MKITGIKRSSYIRQNTSKNNLSLKSKPIVKQQSLSIPASFYPIYFTGVEKPDDLPVDWSGPLPNYVEPYIAYNQINGIIPKVLDKSLEDNEETAFSRSYRDNADLSGRDLSGLKFTNSSFYDLDASNTIIKNTNFQDSSLFSANFSNAVIGNGTNFRFADLGAADFSNAKIESKVTMEKANLSDANFTNVNPSYINFRNAFYNDHTILPNGLSPESKKMIKIEKAADLSVGALKGYGTEDTPFSLDNAKFRNTNFEDVDFFGTSAKRVDFKDAYFKNCRMDKTDLTRSYLEGATIENTSMKKARLKQANFKNANLMDVNMKDADLRGAILTWENGINVNLDGAKYDSVTDFNKGFNPEDHGMIKVKTNWNSYGYKTKQS